MLSNQGPLGEPPPSVHADASDLQRFADGRVDPVTDATLIAHVEACAQCRGEVERIRRAAAAVALSSQPPADLFARIKARRTAGERVQLPVGDADDSWVDDVTIARDGHPALIDVHRIADSEFDAQSDALLVSHVRTCDACQREVEEARRVTAVLSLLSHPPNELFERIKARRESGERVILPFDTPAAREALRDSVRALGVERRRSWRVPQWGLAIAATLLLAVGIGREAWRRLQPDSTGTPLPSATTLRNSADSAERLWLGLSADNRRARTLELKQSLLQLHMNVPVVSAPRSSGDSLAVGLLDPVFEGGTLTAAGRDAMRELSKILARRLEYRVAIVRYLNTAPGDSATDPLLAKAHVVRGALEGGGVATDRIELATASYSVANSSDRARIEVVLLAPKPAPEIR